MVQARDYAQKTIRNTNHFDGSQITISIFNEVNLTLQLQSNAALNKGIDMIDFDTAWPSAENVSAQETETGIPVKKTEIVAYNQLNHTDNTQSSTQLNEDSETNRNTESQRDIEQANNSEKERILRFKYAGL
jgi:hypothetical protein